MIFKELVHHQKTIGYEYRSSNCHFFFGTAHLPRHDLQDIFPDYNFRYLKQIHGATVVEASLDLVEADGHWTQNKNEALVIQTADCMPVLFGGPHCVMAVHAGWKGVEQNILSAALQITASLSSHLEAICIGPHLHLHDFEVGLDVATRLEKVHTSTLNKINFNKKRNPVIFPHEFDPLKKRVALAEIARHQIFTQIKDPHTPFYILPHSTLTSPLFHSFRRDQGSPYRQYSFVVRI